MKSALFIMFPGLLILGCKKNKIPDKAAGINDSMIVAPAPSDTIPDIDHTRVHDADTLNAVRTTK